VACAAWPSACCRLASNLGFWWLAVGGKGALPGLLIPAFDWGFVKLRHGHAGGRRSADGDRLREHLAAAWARRRSWPS
jgi:hypothetical protein